MYADGASLGNPGAGGWGVILATPDHRVVELGGRESHTTNNRMELMALASGIERALELKSGSIQIFLDSKYVLDGAGKSLAKWRKNGWKKIDGNEVFYRDF